MENGKKERIADSEKLRSWYQELYASAPPIIKVVIEEIKSSFELPLWNFLKKLDEEQRESASDNLDELLGLQTFEYIKSGSIAKMTLGVAKSKTPAQVDDCKQWLDELSTSDPLPIRLSNYGVVLLENPEGERGLIKVMYALGYSYKEIRRFYFENQHYERFEFRVN